MNARLICFALACSLGAAPLRAQDAAPVANAPAAENSTPPASAPPANTTLPDANATERLGKIERMDAWLGWLDRTQRVSRLAGGIGGLVLGGLDVAAGFIVAFDGETSRRYERPSLAAVVFGAGAGTIAGGLGLLWNETSDEERNARWHAYAHIDELTLTRFEGELAADAAGGRQRRILDGIYYSGIAAGGALTMVLTPLAKYRGSARGLSYGLGGIGLAIGLWQALVKFLIESSSERAYRLYEAGETPDSASNDLHVAPALAANGGGLSISGSF